MKIMHLGDLHLGKSLGEFDLIRDQEYMLDKLLDIADKYRVDAVVIAGDVYDKRIPSEEAVNLLDSFLNKLTDKKLTTLIISGNHDSDDRLNFASILLKSNNIFISSRFKGTMDKVTLKDREGEVNFYLLPFVKASQVRHFYPEEKIESYDDAVKAVISKSDIDISKRNVLISHQFVAGKEDPLLAGSENAATLSVGLVEKISYGIMENFDYVALGHIHSPQQVGASHIRYSGSPLKYSLSEVNNDKSVPIITLGPKGDTNIELVPLRPLRDVRHIKGKIKHLLDEKNITDPEDFIYATLTDEDTVNDAMGIFQQYYPNTVRIDYDNAHTREISKMDNVISAENKPFEELIADFYRQIYGCDISENEIEIMKEVARKAGVIDETC